MMVDIFAYIDRIFAIVRPRKILYMAIDGVAPRAKMNQQRSRRFRSSKEAIEKSAEIEKMREEMFSRGCILPPKKTESEKFDSNCITPGTPFMFRLAECLRYYVHDRLNNDPGWRNIKVILSDANVPGEGEHKIMDFIRRQRASPSHDPNTKHCLCGADADLIMLGLATHEPYFTIIREEFKPNQPRPCELCGQYGHETKECQGLPKEKSGEFDELATVLGTEQEFIFLRLNILREYLERELRMDNLPFTYDFEKALDDWVFMCFFVGNDFLPHLPSLEIREGAIDRLQKLYKSTVYKTGGYLTNSGKVNLDRVMLVLSDLGEVEDEIFKRRRDNELEFRRRDKQKKQRQKQWNRGGQRPSFQPTGQYAPKPIGQGGSVISNPKQTLQQGRMAAASFSTSSTERNLANLDAAKALKAMITNGSEDKKRKAEDEGGPSPETAEEEEEKEPNDEVRLWEDGWKDRYYESKFDVGPDDIEFRRKVGNEYVIGLCWVLEYYYQGCPSWKWYFPYHYAPFASDFFNIGDLDTSFEKNTQPFKPTEQLMGVFPAASKSHVPASWRFLMEDPESEIIDFYPIDFRIDLNGKKYAWQGVALLPFVDEQRLHAALEKVYDDLTPAERSRNIRGDDRLFVSRYHPAYPMFEALYEEPKVTADKAVQVDPGRTQGVSGTMWADDRAVLTGQTYRSPIPSKLKDLESNQVLSVQFKDPQFGDDFIFPATVLKNAVFPDKVLKPEDFNKPWRPQLGFQKNSGYRGRGRPDFTPAHRTIRHGINQVGSGSYSQTPPPQSFNQPWRGGGAGGGGQGWSGRQQNWAGPSGNPSWQQARPAMRGAYRPPQPQPYTGPSSSPNWGAQQQQYGGYQYGGGPQSYSTRGGGYSSQQGNFRSDGYQNRRDNQGSQGRGASGTDYWAPKQQDQGQGQPRRSRWN